MRQRECSLKGNANEIMLIDRRTKMLRKKRIFLKIETKKIFMTLFFCFFFLKIETKMILIHDPVLLLFCLDLKQYFCKDTCS